jgi:hypothetical protein
MNDEGPMPEMPKGNCSESLRRAAGCVGTLFPAMMFAVALAPLAFLAFVIHGIGHYWHSWHSSFLALLIDSWETPTWRP